MVPAEDHGIFTLGTLPDDATRRTRSEQIAAKLHAFLRGRRMTYSEADTRWAPTPTRCATRAPPGRCSSAGTGRGSRRRSVPRPEISPWEARLELARRYLHVVGPQPAAGFAWWAGINPRRGRDVFEGLAAELVPVVTPLGSSVGARIRRGVVRAGPRRTRTGPAPLERRPVSHGGDRGTARRRCGARAHALAVGHRVAGRPDGRGRARRDLAPVHQPDDDRAVEGYDPRRSARPSRPRRRRFLCRASAGRCGSAWARIASSARRATVGRCGPCAGDHECGKRHEGGLGRRRESRRREREGERPLFGPPRAHVLHRLVPNRRGWSRRSLRLAPARSVPRGSSRLVGHLRVVDRVVEEDCRWNSIPPVAPDLPA